MTNAAGSFDISALPARAQAGVARLWGQAFDSTIRERLAYLEWKYEQNPYFREPILVVALDARGRVVGTRGFLGSCWQTPTGVIPIPCAEDFAIAPRYRETGLATAIMRFALDDLEQRGFEYVMNASGGQITVLNSLAMGWKTLGPMQPVARMTTPTPRVRAAQPAVLGGARRLFRGRLSRTIYRRLRRPRGCPSRSSIRPKGRSPTTPRRRSASADRRILLPRRARRANTR